MKWLALMVLLIAVPVRAQVQQASIAIDSTPIVLRVINYNPFPVVVYVEPYESGKLFISNIAPNHEGFFLLPSREIRQLLVFKVIVESAGAQPYRTGIIARNPTKLTLVAIAVGTPPDSTLSRGRQL